MYYKPNQPLYNNEKYKLLYTPSRKQVQKITLKTDVNIILTLERENTATWVKRFIECKRQSKRPYDA